MYLDDLGDELYSVLDDMIYSFEDNLAAKVGTRVPEYDGDMCVDTESDALQQARSAYLNALVTDLIGKALERPKEWN